MASRILSVYKLCEETNEKMKFRILPSIVSDLRIYNYRGVYHNQLYLV